MTFHKVKCTRQDFGKSISRVINYSTGCGDCSIYMRVNCVQYGGYARKNTRAKFYTNNYTQCKILHSVSKILRVFFTRV